MRDEFRTFRAGNATTPPTIGGARHWEFLRTKEHRFSQLRRRRFLRAKRSLEGKYSKSKPSWINWHDPLTILQ